MIEGSPQRALTERHSSPDLRTALEASRSLDASDIFNERSVRTASLGPSPLTTGSPFTSSVFGRAPRWRRQRSALWAGLGALALLGLGVVVYSSRPAPSGVPYPRARALEEPAATQVQRSAMAGGLTRPVVERPSAAEDVAFSRELATQRAALRVQGTDAPERVRAAGAAPLPEPGIDAERSRVIDAERSRVIDAERSRVIDERAAVSAASEENTARRAARRAKPTPNVAARAARQRPVEREERNVEPEAPSEPAHEAAKAEPADIPLRAAPAERTQPLGANQSPILD